MAFNNTVVARAAASIWGLKLGYVTTQSVLNQINAQGGNADAVLNAAFNDSFGNISNADIAAMVASNLGLTGAAATDGAAYLVGQLAAAAPGTRGATITNVVNLFSSLSADPTYGAFASAFNAKVAAAVAYSSTPGTLDAALGDLPSATSFNLTLGQDNLTGTAGNDTFNAYIFDNSNTLQSGDRVDGGGGNDTLFADMGTSQLFAVTPITTGVENIVIRAQSDALARGENNPGFTGRVQIDAERIVGATRFESNNSRSDVIVEDVRILPSQITKDITIAMVETDPGHVDFGVYFDQYSLRNQSSSTSSINLQIMDTGAAARGEAPLKDSNYSAFTFTVTPPGQPSRVVTLGSQAIQDAQTYAEMRAAFQIELDLEFGAGVATATLGAPFTIVDPLSSTLVTGQSIVLTTQTATVFTTPAGSGWLADGTAPPASNFYTNFTTGTTQSADLVTVKVVLDDVGRGSTGGDLVIGGLSTGVTSSSLGVQRFEVEVQDNSKLESMKSTNNTLREVVIVNGATSNTGNAYIPTVTDAGTLTVNGNSGPNGANISNALPRDAQNGINAPLPNSVPNSEYGFTDVRLIDASAMTGMLAFTAEVTNASLAKYLNLRDIQALPAGDNVAFMYTGGTVNDTMWVALDSTAVASRNTIMSGREDFTFTLDGGNGNDSLTLQVSQLAGQSQAWYANQKLNANITVNGGEGNDTIRTPGAGDVKINGGAGADTIYADNSGSQAITIGTANMAGVVYAAAEAAELAAAVAAATLQNNTDAAKTAAVANDLQVLNLITPVEWNDPAAPTPGLDAQPSRAGIQAGIVAALAANALTPQQAIDLAAAYKTTAGPDTITTPNTLVVPTVTWSANNAAVLTLADFTTGNDTLATYIAAANAAAATAAAAETNWAAQNALLNATQRAVVDATIDVNGGATGNPAEASPGLTPAGDTIGTATVLAAWTTLKAALTVGATQVQVVAAITAAWQAGAFGDPDLVALNSAVPTQILGDLGAFPLAQPGIDNAALFLDVAINNLVNANTAANTALTTATTANNTAVATAAGIVGAEPVNAFASAVAGDFVGKTETAQAATNAANALGTATTGFLASTINPLTGIQGVLNTLKGALSIGTTELNAQILIDNAQAQINAFITTALGFGVVLPPVNLAPVAAAAIVGGIQVGDTIILAEKQDVDFAITALQVANDALLATNTAIRANLQATVTATAFARDQAAAAADGAPVNDATASTSKAVWVLNTANQQAQSATGYVLAENDERNFSDLKSDANNSYNIFGSTVTVTFKGLTATANVPNTGYKTSDLQVNQGIKDAINNNPVLNKLLVATDGPANTLVITSLIDGVMTLDNLGIVLNLPPVTGLAAVDVAAAAPIYGLAAGATAADVLAAMVAAKAVFDTKGDYVDQWAETGAFAGNANITGRASTTPSDNTINGGAGNDVIVLGTTVGSDAMLSSNDIVVFSADFGNDVIVHFKAGALASGGDVLNLSALGGNTLSTAFNVNRSVNVANEVAATNGTATLVAGLFADSTTAQTHVYVAVDTTTNIGKVYQVVDAAGTGAGSVTATLAGTIDLADTLWADLTAVNFG